MKNIAILGGSFDPIHKGHTALARYVASRPDIDEVWLMVTPHNPLKPHATSASFSQRLQMASLALSDIPEAQACDFESRLPAPHFTYATLCSLASTYPDCNFSLLIGSDNWLIFNKWRNYSEIIRDFSLLIYPRPGYDISPRELPVGVNFAADAPVFNEASSLIRRQIAEGSIPWDSLCPAVINYIKTENLYGYKP